MTIPRKITVTVLAMPLLWCAISAMEQHAAAQTAPATTRAARGPRKEPYWTMQPAPPPAPKGISSGQAAVIGFVQGLTEYLPVSSTGHMILVTHYMELDRTVGSQSLDAFEVVLHLGTILAVVGLYRRRVGRMCRGLAGRDRDGLRLVGLLVVAFLPAAIVGKLFQKQIEEHLFGPRPVIYALAVGGVLMIVVERFFWRRRKGAATVTQVDKVLFGQAAVIGLAQCLAMWPGTSRSMITILAGVLVGLDMVTAAEFSFLLALPTLGAATLYSACTRWDGLLKSAGPDGLIIGLVVSGVVAALAVKGFVKWLTRHGLTPFGVYRILLAGAVYWYFFG